MRELKTFDRFLLIQVLLIGLLLVGETIFFFFEQNYFNTFLVHVLELEEFYVTIMVSLSAAMGFISQVILGTLSDNTRTKYGRRRLFLLFGSVVAGISMIMFAFSNNFLLCIIIDVIIIGPTTNAYIVAGRSLIPDLVEKKKRGRANGIINILGNVGLLIALIFFLLANELFAVPNPNGTGTIIPRSGHLFLFMIGGLTLLFCGVIGFIFIREKPVSELPPKQKFFQSLKETFNIDALTKHREFFKFFVALTVFRAGISTIMPFLFIYIFGLGLSTLELLLAIGLSFPILFFILLYLGKLVDKFGRKRFLPLVIMVSCIGLFFVPFTIEGDKINLVLVYFSFPFVIVSLLGLISPINAWSQDLLPEAKRGQFTGILNFTNTMSQVLGAVAAGLIATFINVKWVFPFAALFFIGSIPFFRLVKDTLD